MVLYSYMHIVQYKMYNIRMVDEKSQSQPTFLQPMC